MFNPIIAKIGIRNVFRRIGNTVLVVIGSMVGTALITGSLILSYSLDETLKSVVYTELGEKDLMVSVRRTAYSEFPIDYVSQTVYENLATQFNTPDYDGFLGVLQFPVSPVKLENGEPAIKAFNSALVAINLEDLMEWGSEFDIPSVTLEDNRIVASQTFADSIDANVGDLIQLNIFGKELTLEIAYIEEENGILKIGSFWVNKSYIESQLGLEHNVYNTFFVSVAGGVEPPNYEDDEVETEVENIVEPFNTDVYVLDVAERKSDALDGYGAGIFADMFLILSLFGVIAGIILLVNIFSMLVDERKVELGILRAIALTRAKLTLAFGYESVIYAFFSALVGTGVGIGVGYGIIKFLNYFISNLDLAPNMIRSSFTLLFGFESSTLLIGFSVGFAVTTVTSLILSALVSRLNIVEAIRRLKPKEKYSLTFWVIVKLIIQAVTGLYGIGQIIIATNASEIIRDKLLSTPGAPQLSESLITKYVNLAEGMGIYFGAMIALVAFSFFVYNLVKYVFKKDGLYLVIMISGVLSIVFNTFIDRIDSIGSILEYTEGVVIYFANGLALVISATLIIAVNLNLIAKVAGFFVKRFPRLKAIVNVSFRYPSIHLSRTALTMVMFGIIIYLVIFIGLIRSTVSNELDKASKKVLGEYSLSINLPSLVTQEELKTIEERVLEVSGVDKLDWIRGLPIRIQGYSGTSMAMASGREEPTEYREDFISAAPASLFTSFEAEFEQKLAGYTDDQIWELIDSDPTKIVLGSDYSVEFPQPSNVDINVGDKLTLTDAFEMYTVEVEVVGILKFKNEVGAGMNMGLLAGTAFYEQNFSKEFWTKYGFNQLLIKISSDVDFDETYKTVNRKLIDMPIGSITNIAQVLVNVQAVYNSIMYLFQGFLAFNLLVGSAGLAIVTVRSVQERKQQIGMLRALGFKRGNILSIFFIEISFIAVISIGVGLSMGIIGALNAFNAAYSNQPDIKPIFPTLEIILICVGVYIVSVLLSLRPAINASKLEPVEATNYPE